MKLALLALSATFFFLQGCALLRPPIGVEDGAPPSSAQLSAWQAHHQRMRNIEQFILRGRIASSALGFKASLRWKQQANGSFAVRLLGPFGSGATRISGNAERVTVQRGRDRAVTTHSPEQWLEKNVGAPVPLAGLRWWVLGIPAPDSRHHIVLNPMNGLASRILQDDWSLEFLEYQSAPPLMLPTKIRATRGDTRLLVLADHWDDLGGASISGFVPLMQFIPAKLQKHG